jgi:hypothetical protein
MRSLFGVQLREDWHCGLLASVSCDLRDDWETLQHRLERSAVRTSAHQRAAQVAAAALEVVIGVLHITGTDSRFAYQHIDQLKALSFVCPCCS